MSIERLGVALRQIKRLFADGVISGLPDAQLLDRFIEQRDPGAFEAMVARHGPMVLSVCRGILRDPNDAEDAFQATFLVMVKKAGTIRGRHTLGGWLYQVAHRVATQANKAAARRRTHEREAGQMATAITPSCPTIPDELLPALHEEIARLPEKYRLPLVLCDLEGMTQVQAAGELGWSERTLRRRLAEARERLKSRLGRRGLVPDDAMLGAAFLREARALVPVAWQQATVRAALDILNHTVAVGAVSMAAQSLTREVLKIMLLQKLKLASAALITVGVTAWAASAALISRGDEAPKAAPPPAVVQRANPAPQAHAEADLLDAVGTFPVSGRVLDPDGKPVAGAEVYITHHHAISDWDRNDPLPQVQKGRITVAGADGLFHFDLDKASSDSPYTKGPAWHEAEIAAVAPGFGPAWIKAGLLRAGSEATLRLVRDDVPIRGRILDSQGRPVAGVTVRINDIATANDGVDLDALLATGALAYAKATSRYVGPTWLGRQGTWTTDADGRFEIKGVGRDRIVGLGLEGAGLEHGRLFAMARPARTTPKPRPQPTRKPRELLFYGRSADPPLVGAKFDHIAVPTKPITGVVRLKATGKPVAGVSVAGIEPVTWTVTYAQTDAQGRFRLVGLPKAEVYQVHVEPRPGIDPFLRLWTNVSDTEGLKPIEMVCELPKGVVVTGRLIDTATDRPVRAKEVHFLKLPTNLNEGEASLGNGKLGDPRFGLTVPPGEGMLLASACGLDTPYIRARLRKADKGKGLGGLGDGETRTTIMHGHHTYRMINVPADAKTFSVDLELTRGLTRKGRVIGPDGQPVTGAQCYGPGSTWGYVKTLADETFEVHALEPGYPRQVIFAHQGRRLVGSVVIKDEDLKADAPLEVRLGPAGSIKGRLVDEDGLPLTGATLSVTTYQLDGHNLPSGTRGVWPDNETFTVSSDGRFEVVGLKPGVKCFIGIAAKTRANYRLDAGGVFRNIVLQRFGEVRDVGDVSVKVVPNNQ
ncbi:MAG: sigma-70 family RNA polymerase sigma factor [Isosphaerales bacterium]